MLAVRHHHDAELSTAVFLGPKGILFDPEPKDFGFQDPLAPPADPPDGRPIGRLTPPPLKSGLGFSGFLQSLAMCPRKRKWQKLSETLVYCVCSAMFISRQNQKSNSKLIMNQILSKYVENMH